jgi:RimJ/RimL family protein N-acetyltransferase
MIQNRITLWATTIGLLPFEEPLTDAEIARVYRWSKDESVLRWSGGIPTELSFPEFAERLRNEQRHPLDNRIAFFIVNRNDELIGRIGVFAIDWNKREGELGIVIGETTEWNKGYGRQAIRLLLQHLFASTTLERIILYTFTDNLRAQHCFAACGFRAIGTARRFSPDIGEYDGIEMEITRQTLNQA